MCTCTLTSVSSAKVMEHVCANREHRKRATSWGIGVQPIHTDKMHYYLCTLINGESKLSINHVCPRGWETGGARQGGEERKRQGCGRHEGSRPCVSQTRKTQIRSRFVRLSGRATSSVEGWLRQCHAWMGHTDTSTRARERVLLLHWQIYIPMSDE